MSAMTSYQKVLLLPGTPILEVIKTIDASGLQIAVVVDEDQRLLGTVTDGDIRRAILRSVPLANPVSSIMNRNPVAASNLDGRENMLAIMRATKLRQIPVVDEGGFVTGLECFDALLEPDCRQNWVILMAGGLGSRLRPLTNDCPKPLLKVGSKPILETIIESFRDQGLSKFYLSVNYKAEMLESYFQDGAKWGVEIRYLHEDREMGTAGPLSLLPKEITSPVIVMNGDLLTRVNFNHLLDFHQENSRRATVCVKEHSHQIPYGVVRIEDNHLTSIEEKPVQHFFINAGVYVLDPSLFALLPREVRFDMPDLFRMLLDQGETTSTFPIREYWIDIGRMDDFERARCEYDEIFA
jgi:dTDP-glucose pyrophosphorylase